MADPQVQVPPPPRALRGNAALAAVTALACLVAAAAEGWRFALMLRGRTWVLSGTQVRASDALLIWSSTAAVLLAVTVAAWTIVNLTALHRGSAVRNGWAPSRTGAGVVSRLVVPGWNVYGAGQILAEIDGELAVWTSSGGRGDGRPRPTWPPALGAGSATGGTGPATGGTGPAIEPPAGGRDDGHRFRAPAPTPGPSTLILVWWGLWVVNAVLTVVTLVSAFWRSTQAMANTVEWHVALDLSAAAVAGVLAAVLLRFEGRWSGRGRSELAGWTVAAPASTARNRRPTPATAEPSEGTAEPSEGQSQDGAGGGIESGAALEVVEAGIAGDDQLAEGDGDGVSESDGPLPS